MLFGVDWRRTRAYAIGINGLYLNLAGREVLGIVGPGTEQEQLLAELKSKLEQVTDPLDGRRAIKTADRSDQIYHGDMISIGPDIVVGYYRAGAAATNAPSAKFRRPYSSRTTCSSGAATTASPRRKCRES